MSDFDVPAGLPVLSGGGHDHPSEGACFMEYVGFLAGEKWGDSPECVNSALTLTMQSLNDGLRDENRSLLMPLLDRTIGLGAKPKYVTAADFKAFAALPHALRIAEERRYEKQNILLARLAFGIWNHRGYLYGGDPIDEGRVVEEYPSAFMDAWSKVVEEEVAKPLQRHEAAQGGHLCWSEARSQAMDTRAAGEIALRMATELHEDFEAAMAELGWERYRVPQRSVDDAWEFLTWIKEYPTEYTGSTMSQL